MYSATGVEITKYFYLVFLHKPIVYGVARRLYRVVWNCSDSMFFPLRILAIHEAKNSKNEELLDILVDKILVFLWIIGQKSFGQIF